MTYILYNPHSGNGKSREIAEELYAKRTVATAGCAEALEFQISDITEIDYPVLFSSLAETDTLIICGGDGTINRFVNDTEGIGYSCRILYMPCGTGNDFYKDVMPEGGELPFDITDYLKGLPSVTVDGKTKKFINGIGFGIDGYCCEVGDAIRAKGKGSKLYRNCY